MIRQYFDKFFEVLPSIAEGTTWKYFETFFYGMLPMMEITDSNIVKLVALKNDTADSQLQFSSVLQDGIELLLRSK